MWRKVQQARHAPSKNQFWSSIRLLEMREGKHLKKQPCLTVCMSGHSLLCCRLAFIYMLYIYSQDMGCTAFPPGALLGNADMPAGPAGQVEAVAIAIAIAIACKHKQVCHATPVQWHIQKLHLSTHVPAFYPA